jgi:glycosyltransferase involved in cell wall biosynthesis
MRILLMADLPAGPDSGAAGTEYQTLAALRRLGHEVDTVWADSLPHRVTHGGLHYLVELPRAYRKAMLDRMKNARYDVIHVNQPHGYLAAKALVERREDPVLVHRSHGLELRVTRELERWRPKFPAEESRSWMKVQASRVLAALLARHSRAIARYAHGHIVSASDCFRFLNEEMGVPIERIALIPQAAPPEYVRTPAPGMTGERQIRLLYVGQYTYMKAPMIVAATLNRVIEIDRRVRATWVTSRAAHSQIRGLLRETARERVTLMDWMPQDKLMQIYDSHGIFLFPSLFEGFGKAFLEAMSRGLCVIAADNSGAKDVIIHGKCGVLVSTGDTEQMVQACLDLLDSKERTQALSRLAAMRAREYTWDRVARELVTFYETLLRTRERS